MFNLASLHLTTAFQPRADNIIVLPLVKAGSSFIVTAGEDRETPEKGLVIAVGPGGIGPETGKPVPVESKLGELVTFGKYAGLAWEMAGPEGRPVKAFILRDAEVLLAMPADQVDLEVHAGHPIYIHERGLTCEHCAPVAGEAGVERLRMIAGGLDPDAPGVKAMESHGENLIELERARLREERTAREAVMAETVEG